MAEIKVTPETLRERANTLRGYKGDHDQAMTNIKTLVNSLNDVWTGSAQQAFVTKYDSMQSTFAQFSEMLEGYAKLMDTAAQQMEQTDQTLQSTMSSFG